MVVESSEKAEADGGTAAQAAGAGNRAAHDQLERLGGETTGLVVSAKDFLSEGMRSFRVAGKKADIVVKAESQTEGIEPWTEVGGRSGHANPEGERWFRFHERGGGRRIFPQRRWWRERFREGFGREERRLFRQRQEYGRVQRVGRDGARARGRGNPFRERRSRGGEIERRSEFPGHS